MFSRYSKLLFSVLGVFLVSTFAGHASAQCCQNNKSYVLTITFDNVTVSTTGSRTGTPNTVTRGQEEQASYNIQLRGGTYGEPPVMICQVDSQIVFNEQVTAPSGGSFWFTAPSTAGTHYFTCSLTYAGSTPQFSFPVN